MAVTQLNVLINMRGAAPLSGTQLAGWFFGIYWNNSPQNPRLSLSQITA